MMVTSSFPKVGKKKKKIKIYPEWNPIQTYHKLFINPTLLLVNRISKNIVIHTCRKGCGSKHSDLDYLDLIDIYCKQNQSVKIPKKSKECTVQSTFLKNIWRFITVIEINSNLPLFRNLSSTKICHRGCCWAILI